MGGGRLVGGAAGGGVQPLASKRGVWGSAVSSPIGAWGGAPEAFTFFASNHAKNQRIRSAVRIYTREGYARSATGTVPSSCGL